MMKHLVLFGLLILTGCAADPYAKTTNQQGSCSGNTSASLQLAISNLPTGSTSHTFAGTLTDPDGTAVTLTASATSTGGLLTGTVTPGTSYTATLTDGGTQFFHGSLSLSAGFCSYSATVNYQTGAVTNGG